MARLTPEQKLLIGIGKGIKAIFDLIFGSGGAGVRSGAIDKVLVREKWQTICNMVQQGGESRFKSAVMEADKLLDYALRERGYRGETMGERLRSAEKSMDRDTYNAAWEAHKLRNRVVHEINHELFHWEAQKAISNFEKVLRSLGAF